jgi:hypothetical protein
LFEDKNWDEDEEQLLSAHLQNGLDRFPQQVRSREKGEYDSNKEDLRSIGNTRLLIDFFADDANQQSESHEENNQRLIRKRSALRARARALRFPPNARMSGPEALRCEPRWQSPSLLLGASR